MSVAIRCQGLTRLFPNRVGSQPIVAVDNVDLELDIGEVLAIVGPSGCGKSTLLNLVGLLDRPTSGRVLVEDHDTATLDHAAAAAFRARMIGFVFQRYCLIEHLTVLENVKLAVQLAGDDRCESVAQVLEKVGLGDRMAAFPSTLSGGQAQRAAVARALVKRPKVLLCDEPTGNLDGESADRVMALLDAARTHCAVVIVTHDPAIAARADRTATMNAGALT